jgi:hypothetical protein
MKKTVNPPKKIIVSLSNNVTMEIVFSDPLYTEKYANELRVTGTLLGSWINKIEVI